MTIVEIFPKTPKTNRIHMTIVRANAPSSLNGRTNELKNTAFLSGFYDGHRLVEKIACLLLEPEFLV